MRSTARLSIVLACLGVSSAAFAASVWVERLYAPTAFVTPDTGLTRLAVTNVARLPTTAVGAAPTATPSISPSVEATPPPVVVSPSDEAPVDSETRVRVPDFVGLRLSEAKRTARALGLRIRARDASGSSIPPDVARYYRVRSQRTDAGTDVASNDFVEVRVREAVSYGGGY